MCIKHWNLQCFLSMSLNVFNTALGKWYIPSLSGGPWGGGLPYIYIYKYLFFSKKSLLWAFFFGTRILATMGLKSDNRLRDPNYLDPLSCRVRGWFWKRGASLLPLFKHICVCMFSLQLLCSHCVITEPSTKNLSIWTLASHRCFQWHDTAFAPLS